MYITVALISRAITGVIWGCIIIIYLFHRDLIMSFLRNITFNLTFGYLTYYH